MYVRMLRIFRCLRFTYDVEMAANATRTHQQLGSRRDTVIHTTNTPPHTKREMPEQLELFHPDPSLLFPVRPDLLQCSEENHPNDDGENEGAVQFTCTVSSSEKRLVLRCRDPSSGLLLTSEPTALPDATGAVDPFFFDANYDLAGKTGFQIWPGSRLMTEALTMTTEDGEPLQPQNPSLTSLLLNGLQEQIRSGARVLELGSGIGLVGIALAAVGAQVILTDLPTLVTHAIGPNIDRNANKVNTTTTTTTTTTNDAATTITDVIRTNAPPPNGNPISDSSSLAWNSSQWIPDAVAVGRGWAQAAVLDWMKPLDEQKIARDTFLSKLDLVVSCDGLWLKRMLESILNVLDSVFALSDSVQFLFTYQRRGKNEMFTTLEGVLDALQRRGWTTECLAWRTVHCGTNEDGSEEINPLFLFRTTPSHQ